MIEVAWSDLDRSEFRDQRAALTIGVFDGLHKGHLRLLQSITRDQELLSVVVTFQRHPAEILAAGSFPGFIMSLAQKREALKQAGIGLVVLIDFSLEFSRLSGVEFLGRLVETFNLEFAGIGHDFRCGRGVGMDGPAVMEYLSTHGVRVSLVDAYRDGKDIVSSTRIRECITAGKLDTAQRLLGRPFALDLDGETIERDGSEAWISLDERGLLPQSSQILPPPGDYPVQIVACDGSDSHGHLTIGRNSIRLALAPKTRIRYIVLQENRVL